MVVVVMAVVVVVVAAVVVKVAWMSDDLLGSWGWSIIHCLRIFRHKKRWTNGPKDQQTNQRMDQPSYKDGWTLI